MIKIYLQIAVEIQRILGLNEKLWYENISEKEKPRKEQNLWVFAILGIAFIALWVMTYKIVFPIIENILGANFFSEIVAYIVSSLLLFGVILLFTLIKFNFANKIVAPAEERLARLKLPSSLSDLYSIYLQNGRKEKISKEEYKKINKNDRTYYEAFDRVISEEEANEYPVSIGKIRNTMPTSTDVDDVLWIVKLEKRIRDLNLLGFDLRQKNLFGCVFKGVILDNADLSNAKLNYCGFYDVNFGNANLSNVDLRCSLVNNFCTFSHANLTGANLSGVILRYKISESEIDPYNQNDPRNAIALKKVMKWADWFSFLEESGVKGIPELRRKYEIVPAQWINKNTDVGRDSYVLSEHRGTHHFLIKERSSPQTSNAANSIILNQQDMNEENIKRLLIAKEQEILTLETKLNQLKGQGASNKSTGNWGCGMIIVGVVLFLAFGVSGHPLALLGVLLFVIGIISALFSGSSKETEIKQTEERILKLKHEVIEMKHK